LSRILEACLAAWAVAALSPERAWARPPAVIPDYCRGGKPVRELTMFYSVRVPRAPAGTPLDVALLREQEEIARLRTEARSALRTQPPPAFAWAMDNYTFLIPESEKDAYGLGDLVAMTQISEALRYRPLLWRRMIERFTTVREAPSEDPYVMRFEVSLDLSYYCRYRRRIQDLVTR
jgi:hypothetical protein